MALPKARQIGGPLPAQLENGAQAGEAIGPPVSQGSFFFQDRQTLIHLVQCFLHRQRAKTERLEAIPIDNGLNPRRILGQDPDLLLSRWLGSRLTRELMPHDPNPILHRRAQVDFDRPIPLLHQPPCLAQGMKLTHLVRNTWPRRRHRLAQRFLSIGHHTQNGKIPGRQWSQQPLTQHGRLTREQILGGQEPTREDIADEVDHFIAFVQLDAINGQDHASIGGSLLPPGWGAAPHLGRAE